MNTAQRILKFLAMAVAAVLVIAIFSGVAGVGMLLGRVLGPEHELGSAGLTEISLGENVEMGDVRRFEVRVKTVRLKIVNTDESKLKAESNTDRIKVSRNDETLVIEEEDFNFFENMAWGDDELIIYLPKVNHEFDVVRIETGAGKTDIDRLETKELYLNMGVGKVEIQEAIARNKTEINGGAGLLIIQGGELANLDFDMGVGRVEITAKVLGSSEIDAGLGKLDLHLLGGERDYRINVNEGLGSVRLNGDEIQGDRSYGDGDNLIRIDGGVGAIEVTL